jgi:hypothetical protein
LISISNERSLFTGATHPWCDCAKGVKKFTLIASECRLFPVSLAPR